MKANQLKELQQAVVEVLSLATPEIIGSSLMPVTVPSAKPDKTETVTNDYTASAHVCAEGILKATQGRYNAWTQYAELVPNMDHLEAAYKALVTELDKLGYSRAQVEASEWRVFAMTYHYNRDAALKAISPDRTVPVTDKDGHTVKDSEGNIKRRRPTSPEIIETLRGERDSLSKAGKIPVEVYKPKAKPANSSSGQKLTAIQFAACERYFQEADSTQFGSLWVRFLGQAAQRQDAAEFLGQMVKMIRETQKAKGFVKAKAERVMVPATV